MSTTPVLAPESEAARPPASRSRLLWTFALIAVVVIGAVALWLVLADEGEPTATFDGETATYSGPTSFESGVITFTFDATEYDTDVAFVVIEILDETMTMADIEAYSAENSASPATVPPFAGRAYITFATPDDVVEKEITLAEGTWLVSANTAPDQTDRVYPAALLEVTG